jgi:NADPH:quinone reductase-like Zn-dependent oxidoreductase
LIGARGGPEARALGARMRAAICTSYGGPEVVRLAEVPPPVARDDEILVRVHATTVASGDCRLRGANFPAGFGLLARLAFGITRPRQPILGTELAGVVESTGARVTRFRPGDEVFAMSGAKFGCHAEYKALRAHGPIAPKPANLALADAAALAFGGTTALHFLRGPGRLQRGERVLVNGASGAVGVAAIQLARHFGAHVTGVCSARNTALVRSLGAAAAIDYATTDFAECGERWDVVLDTVGNASFARGRHALNPGGRLLLVAGTLGEMLKAPIQSLSGTVKVAGGTAPERAEDLMTLKRLCEAGEFTPVIDSRFAFDRIAAAHARADTGRKVGSVLVTL